MYIDIKLNKNFVTQYNKLQNEYGTYIARLNGFDDNQLSYTDFIDNFIDKDVVADSSIDGNSNVRRKDIVTLLTEMPKPHRKLLAFHKIYYEYQKKYGFSAANDWLKREWIGQQYLHDGDTSTFKHYCFAYDLKDLAEQGLYFLKDSFNPKPPKHLITFVEFVKEYINFSSNRSSGAVGLPNLIPYMYYFWQKDVKENYMGIRVSKKEKDYAKQNFQSFIYAVNQPCVRDGQQSAFTNTSVFDRPFFEALFGGSEFPDGTFMIDFEEEIIEFQKLYMETMAEIRSENMFTFPVSSISLLRKNGKFIDDEFAKWAIKHNIKWSDSNLFIDNDVTSLSNCCRLKSNVKDLGYFNSIGGTALKVGSVKVSTINLARIALDTNNEDEYLKELEVRTLSTIRVLDIVRNIIKRNVEKGLLPNFQYKLVDFEHLYNTIGFIGIYETMKKFGYITADKLGNVFYTEKASAFGKKIFDTMRRVADDFILENNCDYMINTEQIPGETAASKLMQKDKFFYPKAEIYDLPLYGNQFIPLGIKTTLIERIRIQALFDGFCNGGSILHINIDKPFDSFEKAYKMTCYIADAGVTYFAFNTKIQACKNNHGFYGTVCPICGEPVETEYTRIVGFYTPMNKWEDARYKEGDMRKYEDINKVMISEKGQNMIIKGIIDEDYVNYKKISMFIACHSCSFKCDKLSGKQVCQNISLVNSPNIEISIEELVKRYLSNPLSKGIVFGGLEPFEDIENVIRFIDLIRSNRCSDDVVIYTGYTEEEITTQFKDYFERLKKYDNIVIKFGRFIPDQKTHFDEVLGIELQSDNQYAKKIS